MIKREKVMTWGCFIRKFLYPVEYGSETCSESLQRDPTWVIYGLRNVTVSVLDRQEGEFGVEGDKRENENVGERERVCKVRTRTQFLEGGRQG